MIAYLKPYSETKDSGVESLGKVPEHWKVRQLRHVADLRVSNVDKHTIDGELPIRLCNYVDVYKHDWIQPTLPFMTATATAEEIERFRIEIGDVLLTKDSESWTDIGVPALVVETAPDLICAYHLAMLRPSGDWLLPGYLFRAIQSNAVAYQFHVGANGVTRYGLSHAAIKSVRLPVPPMPEQTAIVHFLDHADRRISRYIRAKQKLIALLDEQRQAIIHHAVTRGLNVGVSFKPSGSEWLGDVPEHWEVPRLGVLLRERGETNKNLQVSEVLSVLRGRGVIPYAEKGNIGNKKSEDITRYKIVRPDDIVVNSMNVIIGSVGLSRYTGCLSPVYYVLTRRDNADDPRYLNAYFQTKSFQRSLVRIGNGILAHRMRIPMELLKCELFPRPPSDEQAAIVQFIDEATASIAATIHRTNREIALLGEHRTRLIADVVTGKLDVREAAARLPAELEPFYDDTDRDIEEAEDDLDPEFEAVET